MFDYLTHDNALFMRGILFFAVVGIFKTVELIINRVIFTKEGLFFFFLAFTALNYFKH